MKKILFVILPAILVSLGAQAQLPDSIRVAMNNISIPTSPGFILLDESPTVIDRPASAKAFAASIFNSYKQAGGFPSNYAVEFSPFWFFKHPRMNAFRYLGYDKSKGKQLPFAHLKKASLSLAYVNKEDTGSVKGISTIAFGVRTTLVSVRSRKNIEGIIKANEKVIANLRALNMRLLELDPLEDDYPQKVKALIDNYENDKDLVASEKHLKKQIEVKPVFAIDAAFAYSTFFLNNKYADQHFGRLGIWGVLNFSQALGQSAIPTNYVNIYGIFRYLQDGMVPDDLGGYKKINNVDFGGKAELELNKLQLAVEYLLRNNENENTFRAVGMVNYRLTEAFALSASFGRNFGEEQNLVTMFGLSFGINSGNEQAMVKE